MKVKLQTEFNQETQKMESILTKGKTEEEMLVGTFVGRYLWKDRAILEKFTEDLNIAFEKMWH